MHLGCTARFPFKGSHSVSWQKFIWPLQMLCIATSTLKHSIRKKWWHGGSEKWTKSAFFWDFQWNFRYQRWVLSFYSTDLTVFNPQIFQSFTRWGSHPVQGVKEDVGGGHHDVWPEMSLKFFDRNSAEEIYSIELCYFFHRESIMSLSKDHDYSG